MGKKTDASLRKLKKAIQAAVKEAVPAAVKKAVKAEITKTVESAVKKALCDEVNQAVQAAVKSALQAEARKASRARKLQKPEPLPATEKPLRFDLGLEGATALEALALPTPGVPAGIVAVNYGQAMQDAGAKMFGSTDDNNCAFAAVGNLISCWAVKTGSALKITDANLAKAWGAAANDTSENPQPSHEISIAKAVAIWKTPGIGNAPNIDAITQFCSLDPSPKDYTQLCQAISTFGGVLLTLNVPDAIIDKAGAKNLPAGFVWDTDHPIDQTQGHNVAAVGFGNYGINIVSWGLPYILSWTFLQYQASLFSSFGVLDNSWLVRNSGPSGLDAGSLQNAFNTLFKLG